ncbi:MAG: 50S ribosomal protein L24e [Candidatus Njordarchaeales archaeon]
MPKCSFCGKEIPPGTGIKYVFTSGKELWFCSKKCKIHALERKRNPAKVKWTEAYRIARKKRVS